jgi:hypothetical protein
MNEYLWTFRQSFQPDEVVRNAHVPELKNMEEAFQECTLTSTFENVEQHVCLKVQKHMSDNEIHQFQKGLVGYHR